jgi:uncharacterized protein YbaR (Trm112 family)
MEGPHRCDRASRFEGRKGDMSEETGPTRKPERVDPRLLELLVCPLTRTTLIYDEAAQELISRAAGLAFPIKDGVPLMTVEAARKLE